MRMRAIIVRKPGGPEALELTTVPRPQAQPGWSVIQVKGRGINHSEVFTREGQSPSVHFPRILGIEAVGVMAETTEENRLPSGQPVVTFMGEMGRAYDGSYAEYVRVPNAQIFPVTTDLSWPELAAVPETYYTAFGALQGLQLAAGQRLLVRGGTSGVGVAAVKLAHAMADVTVIASTRHLMKADQLRQAGFDDVVEERDGKLRGTEKVDRILDLIGPATVKDSLAHVTAGGIVSSTGQLGGQWTLADFDPIMAIPNDAYLTSFYSGEVRQARLQALLNVIARRQIDVHPVKTFALGQMRQAHEYLASQHSFGKVVVLS